MLYKSRATVADAVAAARRVVLAVATAKAELAAGPTQRLLSQVLDRQSLLTRHLRPAVHPAHLILICCFARRGGGQNTDDGKTIRGEKDEG